MCRLNYWLQFGRQRNLARTLGWNELHDLLVHYGGETRLDRVMDSLHPYPTGIVGGSGKVVQRCKILGVHKARIGFNPSEKY